MKNKLPNERGQVLIIIALAAVGLIAIVGLAIDGGAKFADQRHAQNAADTAALAGAYALTEGDSLWKLAASQRAEDNGYTHNLVTTTVVVYQCDEVGADCGYYDGNEQYIRVVIDNYINTTLARVIGIKQLHNRVHAVAFAKVGGNLIEGAMIVSYDPDPNCSVSGTGGYSVEITGGASVNLTGGGLFLNSDEVCGFKIPNCADLNITDGTINSVGSSNVDTAGCTFDPPFTPNYNQDPVVIPDEVYWPDVPPECSPSYPNQTPYKFPTQIFGDDGKWHDQWLIYPGYYTDFPQPALVTNKAYIYMASGVYCIDPPMNKDLSWSPVDAAFLNGSTDPAVNSYASYNPDGVTLYIRPSGGFSINASSPTLLDASTTGDYQGYLIILEGTHEDHPNCTINGGADISMEGLIFAPYCNFTINGQAGETALFNAQLVGWDIKVNGTNTINFNYDPSNQVKIKSQVGLMR